MERKIVKYAVGCAFGAEDTLDLSSIFFVTFNTRDEIEALRLASCVCGKENAEESLIVINEDGEVFDIL